MVSGRKSILICAGRRPSFQANIYLGGDSLLLKPQSDHYLDLGIAVKRHWTAILEFAVESKLLIGT